MRLVFTGCVLLSLAGTPVVARGETIPPFTARPARPAVAHRAVACFRPPLPGASVALARARFTAQAESLGLAVVARLGDGSPTEGGLTALKNEGRPAHPFDLDPARVVLLKAGDAATLRAAAARLAASGTVEWIEPDCERVITEFPADLSPPDDPLFRDTRQWGLWNAGAAGVYHGLAGADVGARAAWVITCGANDMTLAIADTGVDPAHPDLARSLPGGVPRWLAGRNLADGPAAAWADSNGHGTAVAGVMAALTDDGPHFDSLGVAGVCGGDGRANAGCRIVPLKITTGGYGYTSSFAIADAIVWATRAGARAINLSFAGGGDTRVERAALFYAITRGCVAVVSSGNGGVSGHPAVMYPAAYAAEGLCVSVGASDAWDRRCAFSSYGPSLDLVAPGLDVWTTAPTYPNAFGARWPGVLDGSGTSFAAPHVTGTIGLMVARRPDLADRDAQMLLRASAHDLGAPGRDDQTGWGRLDAAAAVRAADPAFALWHDERAAEVRPTGAWAPLTVVADSFGRFDAATSFSGRLAEKFEATVTLVLPDSFADDAAVWPRVGGTMALRGDFSLAHWAPWAEVAARDGRRVTLRGFLYRVPLEGAAGIEPAPDTSDAWLPLPPDQARIGFTVFGRRAPPPTAATAGAPPAPGLGVVPNPALGPMTVTGPAGAHVRIADLAGRGVRALVLDAAGRAAWDGRDARGVRVPAGLYFARLADGRSPVRRIVRLE